MKNLPVWLRLSLVGLLIFFAYKNKAKILGS